MRKIDKKLAELPAITKRHIYIPENFDPEALPAKYHKAGRWEPFGIVFSVIYDQLRFYGSKRAAFVKLWSVALKAYCSDGSTFYDLRNFAIRQEWLETNGDWSRKEKYSIGYRLGERFRNSEFIPHKIENPYLLYKLNKNKEFTITKEVLQYLYDNLKTLQINCDIEAIEDDGVRLCLSDLKSETPKFKVCRFNRLHTGLTNLKKDNRQDLTVDDEQLCCLDLSCCQMLLLLCIMRNDDLGRHRPNVEETSVFSHILARGGGSLFPKWEDFLSCFRNGDDLEEFLVLCETGGLYEVLQEEWDCSRDEAKEYLFSSVVYCHPKTNTWKTRRFGERFPTVLRRIRELKAGYYCGLSHSSQRMEGTIIIDFVCERIRTSLGVFVATIHDCIVCKVSDSEAVFKVMAEALTGIGINPTIKMDAFDGSSSWRRRATDIPPITYREYLWLHFEENLCDNQTDGVDFAATGSCL